MFPQSKSAIFGLFALCVLSGVLAGAVTAGPALASDDGEGEGETFAAHEARVVAEEGLVLRAGPSTQYRAIGSQEYGTVVGIVCRVKGRASRATRSGTSSAMPRTSGPRRGTS